MRIVSADDVASLVRDNDTMVIGGSGAGHAVPDGLIAALGHRFRAGGTELAPGVDFERDVLTQMAFRPHAPD